MKLPQKWNPNTHQSLGNQQKIPQNLVTQDPGEHYISTCPIALVNNVKWESDLRKDFGQFHGNGITNQTFWALI